MLFNTDIADLVEQQTHVVIDDYRCFVNSATLIKHSKPQVQRLTVKIAGACSVIESTEAERVAYARAMIHELEISEKIRLHRLRLKMANPWIKKENLYRRIMDGLNCTRAEAYNLVVPFWDAGLLERNKTNRYFRVVGGLI